MSSPARLWEPVEATRLPGLLAAWLNDIDGAAVIAIDGPPCAAPLVFARSLVAPLRMLGRPVATIDAETFWRDASLRLEYGHHDLESYLGWLDAAALRREALEPFTAGRPFLTSLRDPVSNRSTRVDREPYVERTILLVSGTFLLGDGLAFDRTLHLHLPASARARRTPPEQAWTLPAFEHYDDTVGPVEASDVAVRLDRRSPVVRGL